MRSFFLTTLVALHFTPVSDLVSHDDDDHVDINHHSHLHPNDDDDHLQVLELNLSAIFGQSFPEAARRDCCHVFRNLTFMGPPIIEYY